MTFHEHLSDTGCIVPLGAEEAAAGAVGDLCDRIRHLMRAGIRSIVVEWPNEVDASASALAGMVEVQLQFGSELRIEWSGAPQTLIEQSREMELGGPNGESNAVEHLGVAKSGTNPSHALSPIKNRTGLRMRRRWIGIAWGFDRA